MPWTVSLDGVPVAEFDGSNLALQEVLDGLGAFAKVEADARPGYDAIRPSREAAEAARRAQYAPDYRVTDERWDRETAQMLAWGAVEKRLELRDESGALLAADVIIHDETKTGTLQVVLGFMAPAAGVVARIPPPPRAGGDFA
ncbi:MAG: hypothetical protein JO306_14920 [Gemmatimonadetes bacterium]|nr:hypothetical protein [Gemmatimonadota bacterium]